jgi:cell division septal protein FtsQ
MKGPRRKQKSFAARVRPFSWIIVLIAIAAGAAAYWGATWSGFYPSHVAVVGNRTVSKQDILARAQLGMHRNIWLQSMRAAAQRIETLPNVKQAQIHRSLPSSVRIIIVERRPYAVLQTLGGSAVLDHELRVLEPAALPEAPVPTFIVKSSVIPEAGAFMRDRYVRRLRDDFDALARAHVVVRLLRYDRFGDLVAVMPSGVRLLLGDDMDLARKATMVGPVLSQVAANGRRIAAVDLRSPRTPVVVYR